MSGMSLFKSLFPHFQMPAIQFSPSADAEEILDSLGGAAIEYIPTVEIDHPSAVGPSYPKSLLPSGDCLQPEDMAASIKDVQKMVEAWPNYGKPAPFFMNPQQLADLHATMDTPAKPMRLEDTYMGKSLCDQIDMLTVEVD